MQVSREAVEIKKNKHQKVALNRDTGETSLSPVYEKIINSGGFHMHLHIYVAQSKKKSDNNLPAKRLKSAVSKMKL